MEKDIMTDDGSLAFLNLPQQENKQFHCDKITQQELVNRSFWVIDFQDGVKTKFGEDKCVVFIKFNIDDDISAAKKFFTGSSEIKFVLDQVRQRNAFPRRVTMKMNKPQFWLE